jgi:hypothetical protein
MSLGGAVLLLPMTYQGAAEPGGHHHHHGDRRDDPARMIAGAAISSMHRMVRRAIRFI